MVGMFPVQNWKVCKHILLDQVRFGDHVCGLLQWRAGTLHHCSSAAQAPRRTCERQQRVGCFDWVTGGGSQ